MMTSADDRRLIAETLGRLAEGFDGPELSSTLVGFGFADLLRDFEQVAISSLFAAMGYAGSTSRALNDVLSASFLISAGSDGPVGTVVLPQIGMTAAGTWTGKYLEINGLLLGEFQERNLITPVSGPDGLVWARIADCKDLSLVVVRGLDPGLGMATVRGTRIRAELLDVGPNACSIWDSVAAAGQRAIGYQILGAARRMLDLACEHARVRVQFGRPIGAFQAIRHRLANALVAHEAAAAALDRSWDADDVGLAAMLAKSLSGRASRVASRECQQVLAGVGFTKEHPFHAFHNRAAVLDRLMGSSAELPGIIGSRLIAIDRIPRLIDL